MVAQYRCSKLWKAKLSAQDILGSASSLGASVLMFLCFLLFRSRNIGRCSQGSGLPTQYRRRTHQIPGSYQRPVHSITSPSLVSLLRAMQSRKSAGNPTPTAHTPDLRIVSTTASFDQHIDFYILVSVFTPALWHGRCTKARYGKSRPVAHAPECLASQSAHA